MTKVVLLPLALAMLLAADASKEPNPYRLPEDLNHLYRIGDAEGAEKLRRARLHEKLGEPLPTDFLTVTRGSALPTLTAYVWLYDGYCGYAQASVKDAQGSEWKHKCADRLVFLVNSGSARRRLERAPDMYIFKHLPDYLNYVSITPTTIFGDAAGRFVGFKEGASPTVWWTEELKTRFPCD